MTLNNIIQFPLKNNNIEYAMYILCILICEKPFKIYEEPDSPKRPLFIRRGLSKEEIETPLMGMNSFLDNISHVLSKRYDKKCNAIITEFKTNETNNFIVIDSNGNVVTSAKLINLGMYDSKEKNLAENYICELISEIVKRDIVIDNLLRRINNA